MLTQSDVMSTSRRALLVGAAGAAAASIASALGRPTRVEAANGETVTVGASFTGTSSTTISRSGATDFQDSTIRGVSDGGSGIYGSSTTSLGVYGFSSSGIGVVGECGPGATAVTGSGHSGIGVVGYNSGTTTLPGIRGQSYGNGSGVQGFSGSGSPPAAKAKTGVYGYANQDAGAKGVYGESSKGYAAYFAGKVYTSKFHEIAEISTPNAPAANKARLFVRDNGAGKSQLCVRFATGAVQVIKTQP